MKPFLIFFREVKRIFRERFTLLFIALTTAGVVWYCLNSSGFTASDAFILNPSKNSAKLGALLFTLLTLIQLHRDYKNKTDSIVFTYTNPIFYQIRRTLALICVAVVTALIVSVFVLPYALIKAGAYFQADVFAASWYLIFLGSLVLSVLLSSGMYMLFKRVSVAFIAMVALIMLSIKLEYQYNFDPSYLIFWVQTKTRLFSDLISNQFQIDLILYNRLFCMLTAMGVWFLGLCSLRRYGLGLIGSFVSNARCVWLPGFLIITVAFSGVSYAAEPIFDKSIPRDMKPVYDSGTGISVVFSSNDEDEKTNTDLLQFKRYAEVEIDTDKRRVSGKVKYTLQNLTSEEQILPVLVNPGYRIEDVLVNGQPVDANRGDIEECNHATWYINLPSDTKIVLELSYCGRPKNNGSLKRVDTGICSEYVDLPSLGVCPKVDTEVSENCIYSGIITLDEYLTPVFYNGKAKKFGTENGKIQWNYTRGGFMAAEYCTRTFEAGGLEIDFVYFKKHDKDIADMDAVNVMKAAINYFTEVYGALTYQNNLIMLELPASSSGGFAMGNISAMDETCFYMAGYLPNESDNPHYQGGIETIVHEIAHQWWGLATYPMHDGESYWSAEGVTCYSTYRFMEHYFGEDYAKKNFVDIWKKSWNKYKKAFCVQNPEYLEKLSNKDASSIKCTLNNIGLYDIMPLQLLKAEEALGGTKALQYKLSQLYQAYLNNTITYEDFLSLTGLSREELDIA
ncbi:hypothetical protein IMX26_04335 [Clostridium sp. 'deep sea']|uniref:M1 family aminopeptidase n=1 Tax=Clostridium sp. 'deep sea' TaxID=2779445 RepID=UPI0018964651|nr:M1 family aminopeptidase [Clostridium sp. 'deep sea']QOR36049.1 hypothetical protein IMX26_04335 [Clostridium sp. 'deep sea']